MRSTEDEALSLRDQLARAKDDVAAGRAAFTNYLGTTIVMTTIFYGYGLALFDSVPRAALYLFCFAMWAAMLLWSKPWLERFEYGPLEWLWRSLSRWQRQPMRRALAEGPARSRRRGRNTGGAGRAGGARRSAQSGYVDGAGGLCTGLGFDGRGCRRRQSA